MPLLVYAVSSWLAGLYGAALFDSSIELSGRVIVCVAVGVISLFISARSPRVATPAVCLAIGAAGLLAGLISASNKSQCIAGLLKESVPIEVALDSRAAPRAFVRGEARGKVAGRVCTIIASLKVTEGSAPPGAIVRFEGTRAAGPRGLQLEGAVQHGTRMAPLRAWRGRAGETLDTLFGPRAALARALLIADQDGIDPAVRDRFADAGLVHILSISGLHVALIAGALTVIASAMRLPNGPASIGALVLVAVYVLALGAPAPAVRSAVMLGTATLVSRLQRPVHPWTALALGAVIPTFRPDVVFDLGWQLSVSGMASLVAARGIMSRVRNSSPALPRARDSQLRKRWQRFARATVAWLRSLDGWRWALTRELFTGTVASLVTAPIVAWYFGRVSLIAPLANIFASPVIAFLQPALFLALAIAPLRSAAQIAADACILPLKALDIVASSASSVPYAAVHVAPTLAAALALGACSALVVRATAARRPSRHVIAAGACLCFAVWWPMAARGNGWIELHMIDVGQGDAIAVRSPKGRWVVIDAGRSWKGGDAGRRVVVPYLRRIGGDVAAFIMSHPHDDHVGGAASLIEAIRPGLWLEPAYVGTSPAYRAALQAVERHHIPWRRAHPGDSLDVDGMMVRVLAPDSAWTTKQTDPNLASVVVAIEYGRTRWLFTGDAETEEEDWLVERWGTALDASVLKSGHHGSKTSSSVAFLDLVTPQVALVSVGADNTYGHPSPSVMHEYERRGVRTFRTDHDGSLVVRSNGVTQEVVRLGEKWNVPND